MAQLNLTQSSSITSPSTIDFVYYVTSPCTTCKITRTYHIFHTVSLSRTSFTATCLMSSHNITTNFKQVWVHSWQLSSSTEFSYLYCSVILWALKTIQHYIPSWNRQYDYQSFRTTSRLMSDVYWIYTAGPDYLVITSHSDKWVHKVKHMYWVLIIVWLLCSFGKDKYWFHKVKHNYCVHSVKHS